MTATAPPDDLTLFSEHCCRSLQAGELDKAKGIPWSVFISNQGKFVLVESGLEVTFLEGERSAEVGEFPDFALLPGAEPYRKRYTEWACHTDPTFVRPAQLVSERDLTWEAATSFIRKYWGFVFPPLVRGDPEEDPTEPKTAADFQY